MICVVAGLCLIRWTPEAILQASAFPSKAITMSKIKDRPEFRSKSPVMTFRSDATVSTAVRAMSAKNYGAAVIVDEARKPIGIVTERDFMRRLLDKGLDPTTTRLSEIMTRDLKIGRADDTMGEWLRQMSNERFRHVPIVDDDGVLINIMSQGDFVSYSWPDMVRQIKDDTVRSIGLNYQIFIGLGGILIYTAILAFIIRGS